MNHSIDTKHVIVDCCSRRIRLITPIVNIAFCLTCQRFTALNIKHPMSAYYPVPSSFLKLHKTARIKPIAKIIQICRLQKSFLYTKQSLKTMRPSLLLSKLQN